MTVVAKRSDGKVFAFVKGADSVIMKKLAKNGDYEQDTLASLDEFAETGLRTLLFAQKEISESDVQADPATLESGLTLLGASGLEDLLQDDVAECIRDFKLARCKVWMLTGDKGETARNIGISCGIIDLDK